ncbi:MAG TPA: FtsX-like permease family protein [Vicinamibacteria bacterium]
MPFELLISLRYLLAKRKQVFISVISAISTLGVVVGVTILLIALAIMTGFQGELRARILGAASQLSVYSTQGRAIADYQRVVDVLSSLSGIEGASPALYGKALVSSVTGSGLVTLKGIDPVREAGVTEFAGKMVAGSLESLVTPSNEDDTSEAPTPPGIVVGEELALTLGCLVGDSINVIAPEGHLTPFGMLPRSRRFRVVGIYRVGLYDFDNSWALVDLREAQRLLGFGDEAIYVESRVADIYAVKELGDLARRELGSGYGTLDWMEMNRSLFSALWLEKMVTTIFISFIVGVAALNIVASQMMIVMEKTRDIAILRSMGATARSIMTIFMLQGLIVGVVGTLVGSILGVSISWVLDHYRVISIPEDVYQVAFVPFKLLPADLLLVVLAAPLVCFAATIYPARRASRLNLTEALRYE